MDELVDCPNIAICTHTAEELDPEVLQFWTHPRSWDVFRGLAYLFMVVWTNVKITRLMLPVKVLLHLPLSDYFVAPPRLQAVASGRPLSEFCSLGKAKDLWILTDALDSLHSCLASNQQSPAQKDSTTMSLIFERPQIHHLGRNSNTGRRIWHVDSRRDAAAVCWVRGESVCWYRFESWSN